MLFDGGNTVGVDASGTGRGRLKQLSGSVPFSFSCG